MGGLLFLLLVFLLFLGVVIALGSGVGLLLHWLLPDVELGIALLVGTAMSGLALHMFILLFRSVQEFRFAEAINEWEEEEVPIEVPQRGKRNRRR
jgi:hypothetical protein